MLRSRMCFVASFALLTAGCCCDECRPRCQQSCLPCPTPASCAPTAMTQAGPGGQVIVIREGVRGDVTLPNGVVVRIIEGKEGADLGERERHGEHAKREGPRKEEDEDGERDGRAEHGAKPVGGRDEGGEVKVDISALPPAVRKALESLVPGGEIKSIEAGSRDGKPQWEVDEVVNGKEVEVVVDESGEAVKWEIQVEPSQVPHAVLKAAEERVHGKFKMVSEVRDGARNLAKYVVERKDGDKNFEVEVSLEGKVLKVDEDKD